MSSEAGLPGKVVVVTGAGQGQGAAMARLLARKGASVWALDVTDAPTEQLDDNGISYRRLDVTDAHGWTALAAEIAARHAAVHGLVANAGVTWRARLGQLEPSDLARVHEVNVTGTLLGIQTLSPHMTDGGSIVVIGSAAVTAHFPLA